MQFIDLIAQYKTIKEQIDNSISSVLNNANYIQGDEVRHLESVLSDYVGSKCITCANGTDALYIALRALGVSDGDEVIVPSFTWVSTAEVVKLLNAIPIFAEIDQSFNIDINHVKTLINEKTKVIIAVSMFGNCSNLTELKQLSQMHSIFLIEDAAQSFGAKHKGAMSCSIADISTTSFFPAKPLGCYGDGGAIFTDNQELLELMNAISKHGQQGRYNYVTVGMNSRLDTIQAAILLEKIKIFEFEVSQRNYVAKKYNSYLESSSLIKIPTIPDQENRSVWAQYTICLISDRLINQRSKIMLDLKNDGIPTALYYPAPLHLQAPYKLPNQPLLPFTENISNSVLSIPMHPYLSDSEIEKVSMSLLNAIAE